MKMGNVGLSNAGLIWVVGLCLTALAVCTIVGWFSRRPE